MIVECLVIFGIILAIMVIFLRTNKDHAIETVPLLILPGVNILAYFFSEALSRILPYDHFIVFVLLNVLAVIVSSVLVGIFSLKLNSKSNKIAYVSMCMIFNVVLASILIQNMYSFYYA